MLHAGQAPNVTTNALTVDGPRVAVILPCLNEAVAIAGVIAAFHIALPQAAIVVIDNASTDGTSAAAQAAGAEVLVERNREIGRAHV